MSIMLKLALEVFVCFMRLQYRIRNICIWIIFHDAFFSMHYKMKIQIPLLYGFAFFWGTASPVSLELFLKSIELLLECIGVTKLTVFSWQLLWRGWSLVALGNSGSLHITCVVSKVYIGTQVLVDLAAFWMIL